MAYSDTLREMVYSGAITVNEYHRLLGIWYGYKVCCVKNYVNMEKLGIPPAGFMIVVLDQNTPGVNHVLCPLCYEKYDMENPNRTHECVMFVDPITKQHKSSADKDVSEYYMAFRKTKGGGYVPL